MPDREKVMRALRRCIYDPDPGQTKKEFISCSECEYHHGCTHDLMRDALALLKEQEPRVLTREEVMDLLQGSVAWYEEKSESGTYLRALVSAGNGFLGDFYLGINAHEFDFKRGRFWTARPSDEQRKAVKWEE